MWNWVMKCNLNCGWKMEIQMINVKMLVCMRANEWQGGEKKKWIDADESRCTCTFTENNNLVPCHHQRCRCWRRRLVRMIYNKSALALINDNLCRIMQSLQTTNQIVKGLRVCVCATWEDKMENAPPSTSFYH